MGRLPSLVACMIGFACVTLACDENKPKVTVTNERSQAIMGAPSAVSSSPPPKAAETVAPVVAREPRRLCGGHLGKTGPELPVEQPARRSASGERDLPEQIASKGHYTWINFWAAWCGPCKEEIPRLLAWEKKLNASGTPFKVVFVSLDDDERQLTTFLDKQSDAGLRTTYWLPDGEKRTDWLKVVNVKPDAELPVQLLLDKTGHVRCTIGGAVDDSDFDQLRGLLDGTD